MNSLAFILSSLLALLIAPIIIYIAKKMKFGQNILEYVSEHSSKQGTPTMGGIIFILPTIIVSTFFFKSDLTMPLICLSTFFGYGLLGFLDDFIKIKFKRNLGLRAYQKIIFQLALSLIIGCYVYKNELISTSIYIPFSTSQINLGAFIIPFIVVVFLATTNSVNLTDGLDGLAGGTSLIIFLFLPFIITFYSSFSYNSEYIFQLQNLNIICSCISGALIGFLSFNVYPAKIFMGDTGSLALGGLLACFTVFSRTSLYIVILGFMFVISAVSVIIQVLHFKRTKKRIFLMAPFHHHLQHKGLNENKIVFIYLVITTLLCFLTIFLLGIF